MGVRRSSTSCGRKPIQLVGCMESVGWVESLGSLASGSNLKNSGRGLVSDSDGKSVGVKFRRWKEGRNGQMRE